MAANLSRTADPKTYHIQSSDDPQLPQHQSQSTVSRPSEEYTPPQYHLTPISPNDPSASAAYLNIHHGPAIAYPQLPLESHWPTATQMRTSQLAPYSLPIKKEDSDNGRKHLRTKDGSPPTRDRGSSITDDEETSAFNSHKRHKILRNAVPHSTVQTTVLNHLEDARVLAVACATEQASDAAQSSSQNDDFNYMPGAYPNSSQELPLVPTGQDTVIPQALSSSGMQQLSTPPSLSSRTHSALPAVPMSEEPPLCQEQADLVDLICSGRNVFYTGSAGCGKSTVLKAFTKRLRAMGKKVRILAPTGRAALQVGGQTFWTFAGWTPEHMKKPLVELNKSAHGKYVYKRIKTDTDVIVFDEVSMIENHNFERLNELMKEAWYNPTCEKQPAFGGVQVIVTGDFCQLPPVKPFGHCIDCGKGMIEKTQYGRKTYTCQRHGEFRDEEKWAFSSKAWRECNFEHVHLKQIHRQNDAEFIRMLQKCRIGDPLSALELNKLMDHPCYVSNATRLFATRYQAREVNQEMFKKLTGVNNWYWCRDTFIWQQGRHPQLQWKGVRIAEGPAGPNELKPLKALEEHRFDERVELKHGMLVVLLINLDLEAGLCNGSQGLICGFEQFDAAKMPKAKVSNKDEPQNRIMGDRAQVKEQEIKAFIKGNGVRFRRWPVVRFHNGQTRVIFADCSITELGDEQPYSLLIRTQIPLAPAWAMTIHKSQSLTMDRVIVNLSRAFEEGQVYVALSRATSLRGLKIEGDTDAFTNGLAGNREVQRFLREKFGALNALGS